MAVGVRFAPEINHLWWIVSKAPRSEAKGLYRGGELRVAEARGFEPLTRLNGGYRFSRAAQSTTLARLHI